MTAAYRLKGLGWFGSCVTIVLGFYLVSLQVAAERKKLDVVNGRIRAAERDIRALETEFDTRANLVQLERWNGDTLALSAPTAGQFVSDEAQLASLNVNAPGTEVETAALVVPSVPGAQPGEPAATLSVGAATPAPTPVTPAPAVRHAAVQMAAATISAPAPRPTVVKAAAVQVFEPVRAAPATVAKDRLATAARAKAAVAKVRPQAVAMLDNKLLSDTTLGDLLSGARSEASRRH